MTDAGERQHAWEARRVCAEMERMTGRSYRMKLEALDAESLRELRRFVRDAEEESRARARRAQLQPWRKP
jgi:hypothetical protein